MITLSPFALAWAGDIEDIDLVFAHKIENQFHRVFGGNFASVDQFIGSLLLDATLHSVISSAAQFLKVKNHRPVRIFHILQGAFGKTPLRQFFHRIAIRNPTKFIETSGRTPAAAIDSMLQRGIKRRAINSCLSAGNYFHLLYCSGGRVARILQCAADTAASTENIYSSPSK